MLVMMFLDAIDIKEVERNFCRQKVLRRKEDESFEKILGLGFEER